MEKSVKALIYILFLLCEYAANSFLVNDSLSWAWYVFQPQELPIWNFDFLQMEAFLNVFNAQIGREQDC